MNSYIGGDKEFYEFGEFRLDVAEHFLARLAGGERIQLSEKAFETLCVLVRNAGHLVRKDELMNQVWADSFVEENNLDKCIYAIRRALGEKPGAQKFIETVRKHGYRLIVEVRRIEEGEKGRRGEGEKKISLSADSPSPFLPVSSSHKGAVVALADWRHETDKNQPEESIEQFTKLELVPANPVIRSNPKYRALVLAGLILGVIGLGYYFFSASKTASGADGKKSIAILPVQPLTAENRDVIYEFGIADSLTLKLSAAKNLIVRPLSATRQYADITQDAIAAGKEMQVDYVLASNYQIADGKIRVTSQLFNVATGQIEETYKSEKDVGNIFSTQDAIAGEVGNIILARFATTESGLLAKRGTTNEEAYRLYLLSKNLTRKSSVEDKRKAIEYLEQAIRLDPNFARGYAGLAFAYKDPEKAKAAVEKALELDSNLSEAYAVRGSINLFKVWGDYPQAEKDLLRAIELDPNNDLAHWLYGLLRGYQRRFDEAIREIETASAIAPAKVVYIRDRARILYYARRYDEAIVQYKRVLATDEDFVSAQNQLWMSYEMNGDYAMAYEIFIKQREKQLKDEPLEDYKKAYAAAGWQGVMREHHEFSKLTENDPPINFYSIARQCAMLGEKEQAFAYLNKAFEKRQYQMVFMDAEPRFDSLRDDPRFDELVRRVGLK